MKTTRSFKLIFVVSVFSVISSISNAQKSGVFISFADYNNLKMEYGIDCAKEKHKINLHNFLGKDHITVVHEGKKYDLKKSEIFGYQLCDEQLVRFANNEHFPVIEKGPFWIYSIESSSIGTKPSNVKKVTMYYFSYHGDGNIEELTLKNVKEAFPENHKLHDVIDAQFENEASLSEFDTYHKMFKINRILISQEIK